MNFFRDNCGGKFLLFFRPSNSCFRGIRKIHLMLGSWLGVRAFVHLVSLFEMHVEKGACRGNIYYIPLKPFFSRRFSSGIHGSHVRGQAVH